MAYAIWFTLIILTFLSLYLAFRKLFKQEKENLLVNRFGKTEEEFKKREKDAKTRALKTIVFFVLLMIVFSIIINFFGMR